MTRQCRARFRVSFGANIAIPTGGAVGPISLAIAADGEALGSSVMIVTPAAINDYFNIGSEALIDVPADCCVTVTIKNISPQSINVMNANLIVERVA